MPWTTRSRDLKAQHRPLQPHLAMSLAGRNDSPSIDGGLVKAGHANATKPILRLCLQGRPSDVGTTHTHSGTLCGPSPSVAARNQERGQLQISGHRQIQKHSSIYFINQSRSLKARNPQHAPSRRCSSAALIYRLGRYRWSNRAITVPPAYAYA